MLKQKENKQTKKKNQLSGRWFRGKKCSRWENQSLFASLYTILNKYLAFLHFLNVSELNADSL